VATLLTEVDLSTDEDALMEAYVRRWFIPFETLVRRSGGTASQVDALIAAGAAPGVIYAHGPDGVWWSPVGTSSGVDSPEPPAGCTGWYTPAALYWLRRGLLAIREGASPAEAAECNREAFVDQFVDALRAEPLASAYFSDAFHDGKLDEASARRLGRNEWNDWRGGGYGVCLRSFTGASCVTKESLGRTIKVELAGDRRTMTDFELLDLVERLGALMPPFAPYQRPTCTPGLTIDPLLELLHLGSEEPYGVES